MYVDSNGLQNTVTIDIVAFCKSWMQAESTIVHIAPKVNTITQNTYKWNYLSWKSAHKWIYSLKCLLIMCKV